MQPIRLGPNQPAARPYLGGAGILELRGTGSADDHVPEDFVASTTTVHGSETVGLTILDDGRTLRDAVAADPVAYLGTEHVDRHGTETGLLVKILSTGERLFNHFHPSGDFAARHLDAPRGKTEAWLITSTGASDSGTVWLGFRHRVDRAQVALWVTEQSTENLLDALNPLTVTAGDWLFVPAGTPHSIGQGITLVELQEPSDLSILLEYGGFSGIDPADAFLGLDLDTALDALEFGPLEGDQLAALHGRAQPGRRSRLLPVAADGFFRAELLTPDEPVLVEAGFAVLVVLDGFGRLAWSGGGGGSLELVRGDVLLVPHGSGETTVSGGVHVIRCAPPA